MTPQFSKHRTITKQHWIDGCELNEIKYMESGLGIKYRGGGEEGQESQFTSVYSLFFMQAAIIAHNICSGFKAFKLIRKKKYI